MDSRSQKNRTGHQSGMIIIRKSIPPDTSQLFLPLYLKHRAAISLQEKGVFFCGISDATKGFDIHRIADFHFVLFCTSGTGELECRKKNYFIEPGTMFLVPAGLEYKYRKTGADNWRFIWFHIEPGNNWDFLERGHPIGGPHSDVEFIENAMYGFVSEVHTTVPLVAEDQSTRDFYIDSPDLRQAMSNFNIPVQASADFATDLAECYARILLNYLSRELRNLLNCDHQVRQFQEALDRLWKVIGTSLSEEWSLQKMARIVNMSEPTFIRHVKKIYGTTPGRLVQQMRLDQAGRILAETDMPIALITETVGYESLSSFSALFKKHFNLTPSEYRKRYYSLNS